MKTSTTSWITLIYVTSVKTNYVVTKTLNAAVILTPLCIADLDVFRQCLTSIFVIHLGQISNKHRPLNKLNSVLKGKIDMRANTAFMASTALQLERRLTDVSQ